MTPFHHRSNRWLAAVAVVAVLLPRPAAALDPITPKAAITALLRVLGMDRNLSVRGGGDFVVAFPFEKGQEAQRDQLMEIAQQVTREITFKKHPIRFVTMPLKPGAHTAAAFKEAMLKENASAILLIPGLSQKGLEAVVQVANEEKLYTMALDSTLVEKYATMAVEPAEGKMQLLLNADSIRNADGWFEVAVLHVARIYNKEIRKPQQQPAPAPQPHR